MVSKKFFKMPVFVLTAIFIFLFAASASFAATDIKMGHVLNNDHPWHICLDGFAKEVKAATDGRINIQIFPSGQLGSEKDMVEGLRMGTLDGGLIAGSSFQSIDPRFGIEELPYAFDTNEDAYRAFDGQLGDELLKILAKKKIVGISWWENGFRHITNNKHPITKPEDLQGIKIRVTPNKMRLDTFNALGASPMPVSFGELYSAMQQGVVDAQENPLVIFHGNAFYEVQKYLSLTGHIWSSALVCFNEKTWKKISDDDKKVMTEIAHKWRDKEREMIRQSDKDMVAKIKEKGVEVSTVDKAPFKKAVESVWKEFEPIFGKDLMDLIR